MSTPEAQLERVTDGSEGTASAPATSAAPSQPESLADALERAFSQQAPAETVQPPVEQPPAPAEVATPPVETPTTPEAPAEPAQAAAPVQEPEIPTATSIIAPLFDIGQAEDALPRAQDVLKSVRAYDPATYNNLADAVYHNHPQVFRDWALADLGIPKEKLTEFVNWAKSGAGELPNYDPPPFPEPNADLQVRTPDGLELDLNDPRDKALYEAERFRYEQTILHQKAQAETRRATERAEADRLKAEENTRLEQERTRVADYMSAQFETVGKTLESLKIEFADEDDEADLIGAILTRLEASPTLKQINQAAQPYVKQGAGKAAEYQAQAQKEIRTIVGKVVDRHNRMLLRLNRAEQAAQAKAPVLPPGTQIIKAETPPPPEEKPAQTWEELKRRGMEGVGAAISQLPLGR